MDSVFWARFGRRKSWLIPAQYLIGECRVQWTVHHDICKIISTIQSGITMVVSSQYVNQLLGDPVISEKNNSTLSHNDLTNSSIPDREGIEDIVSQDNLQVNKG